MPWQPVSEYQPGITPDKVLISYGRGDWRPAWYDEDRKAFGEIVGSGFAKFEPPELFFVVPPPPSR